MWESIIVYVREYISVCKTKYEFCPRRPLIHTHTHTHTQCICSHFFHFVGLDVCKSSYNWSSLFGMIISSPIPEHPHFWKAWYAPVCASLCRTMSAVILHFYIIVLTCACGSYLCQLCLHSIYGMLLVLEPGVLVGKSSNNYLSISYSVLQKKHSYIIHTSVHPFRHSFAYLLKPSFMSFVGKRYKHPELFSVYTSTLWPELPSWIKLSQQTHTYILQ